MAGPSITPPSTPKSAVHLPVTTTHYLKSFVSSDDIKVNAKANNDLKIGIDVVKVNKHGKCQPRRICLSPNNRTILLTTTRIRSFKGLFKYPLPQTREVSTRHIDISTIDRVQRGQLTQRFTIAKQSPKTAVQLQKAVGGIIPGTSVEESNSLSIVYNGCKESIDLIIPNDDDLTAILSGIEDLIKIYKSSTTKVHRDVLLMEHAWVEANKDLNQNANVTDFSHMLNYLNVDINKTSLWSLFKNFCTHIKTPIEKGLSVRQAALFLGELRLMTNGMNKVMDPAMSLCETNFGETNPDGSPLPLSEVVSDHTFLRFLQNSQGDERATLDDVRALFARLNTQEMAGALEVGDNVRNDEISKKTFVAYLYSDENDAFDPIKGKVGRSDMSQPMSHYWINTSHKTYRTVDEKEASGAAEGGASVQMYVDALYRGCRCVEMDVWDGNSNMGNEPVVSNGNPNDVSSMILSEKIILFVDVVKAIKAFLMSCPDSYPIILSVENHCSVPFQEKMVHHLNAVLDDVLYRPNSSNGRLPSPESIKGKVVIRSKLPDRSNKSASVVNDDFDIDNDLTRDQISAAPEMPDDDDDTVETGIVIGFEAVGSIVSDTPHVEEKTPEELLQIARLEAIEAKKTASIAEQYAFELQVKVCQAEENANRLMSKIGMTYEDLEKRLEQNAKGAQSVKSASLFSKGTRSNVKNKSVENMLADEDDENNDVRNLITQNSTMTSLNSDTKTPDKKSVASGPQNNGTIHSENKSGLVSKTSIDSDSMYSSTEGEMELSEFMSYKTEDKAEDEEGMEVQDFFENAVDHARTQFSAADAEAIAATENASIAMARLQDATAKLSAAEDDMKKMRKTQAEKAELAERAAAEARANRVHANTAASRVITVRDLLKKCRESAGTSENVSVTATAEAKISEQRAVEAETRANKAQATAEVDRNRADMETKKEETLENDAATYQKIAHDGQLAVEKAKERVANAIEALGAVDKRITELEQSSEFKKEKKTQKQKKSMTVGYPHIEKHKTYLEEKKYCLEKVKEASIACNKYEVNARQATVTFEEAARKAKDQGQLASAARRQADQSTAIAEQLTEHAEEEREAANLRHIACEKAVVSFKRSDADLASMKAQLQEAERAAGEAEALALESRKKAEEIAMDAQESKDISKEESHLATLTEQKESAEAIAQQAQRRKDAAVTKANEAKRILETSSEVLLKAQHEAAVEIHRVNAELQAERNALIAHTQAKMLRRKALKAKEQAAAAVAKAADVVAAERHAEQYCVKKAKVQPIAERLAKMTLVGSVKYKQWEKSLSLPYSASHNISEGMMVYMTERGPAEWKQWMEFNKDHLTRTFPSGKIRKNLSNYNPMIPWAMGCQLVSVNVQASSGMLLLVDGRFRENGSCGYVLKPERLKEGGSRIPSFQGEIEKEFPKQLSLRILSGHGLPKPEGVSKGVPAISPRVKVVLYDGVPGEGSMQYTTKTVSKNGLCPVWNEDEGAVFTVSSPSTAMVLFTVWDRDNEVNKDFFIAASAIPFSCLRKGYRSVPLFDSNHTRSGAYGLAFLLVDIDLQ